jgi:hypothetical protein
LIINFLTKCDFHHLTFYSELTWLIQKCKTNKQNHSRFRYEIILFEHAIAFNWFTQWNQHFRKKDSWFLKKSIIIKRKEYFTILRVQWARKTQKTRIEINHRFHYRILSKSINQKKKIVTRIKRWNLYKQKNEKKFSKCSQ